MEGVWPNPARSWLVRGSNVAGADLAQKLWPPEGRVSLAAPRLRQGIGQGVSMERLRSVVEEGWGPTATYNQKLELVEALHASLSRMKPGDTVCTLSGGRFYVGEITGPAEQATSDNARSNLRRPIEWQSTWQTYVALPEEIQQRARHRGPHHGSARHRGARPPRRGAGRRGRDDGARPRWLDARRELELPVPEQDLADRLLVHNVAWLREIRDLLWDGKQIILYGPPGTGKTCTALHLADYLGGGPEQVRLVQFHPSYAYENFFEGSRSRENPETGEVAFRLTAGPPRELADLPSHEGNQHIPHFLIIGEINRQPVEGVRRVVLPPGAPAENRTTHLLRRWCCRW